MDSNSTRIVPHLSYLILARNDIKMLPSLRKFQMLKGLDLSYNKLTAITHDTFSLHPFIRYLDMSHNALTSIPDGSLSFLVSMTYLNLRHNNLNAFNFDQSPLSAEVLNLDIRNNKLSYPPFADAGYVAPRLSYIHAAENPFVCDCNLNPFLLLLESIQNNGTDWYGLGQWDKSADDVGVPQPYLDTRNFMCAVPQDLYTVPILHLPFKRNCRLLRHCPKSCSCTLYFDYKDEQQRHVLINCANKQNITELPETIPVVKDTPLVLFMNQTGLKRLDYRPYLPYVTEFHAGYSGISYITAGVMEAFENISVLALHNNMLRSLPSITQNVSFASADNISLANNPWTCGCHDVWMPRFLKKHSNAIYNLNNTNCRWTGEKVAYLNIEELSCGLFNFVPLIMAFSLCLGLVALTISLMTKYRLEILVFLHSKLNMRPFDMYIYDYKPCLYDAFISFSQHDARWVTERLVDRLENSSTPYKLCIHLRDFPVGAPIAESITWAVVNSRCTLLVLTKHFLASEWCRHELRAAHSRLLRDKNAKLLIVVHGPLDARSLDRELLAYLRTHTYLQTEDKWFWEKLEYALPRPTPSIIPQKLRPMSPLGRPPGAGEYPMQGMEMHGINQGMAAGDTTSKQDTSDNTSNE